MGKKITRTEESDGSPSYTEESTTMAGDIMDAAMSPLSIFSQSNEYVNKSVAGFAALGYGAAGIWYGDKKGIPFLGD